ncbi:MAG: hypothetical protein AB1656_26620 [Candidatus Omnitrophota bacterium]
MNTKKKQKYPLLLLSVFSALLLYGMRHPEAKADSVKENNRQSISSISDKPLAVFQIELLELAFSTATAIPIDPHINDRSKAQEAVVAACLKLDQPHRALEYIEKIGNWRRGSAYADLAFYYAQRGSAESAHRCVQLADQVAEKAEDWRRDRIRVNIVKTFAWLGEMQKAEEYAASAEDSETGKAVQIKAMASDESAFDEQMKALDDLIASGKFDILRNALEACARIFDRFYSDAKRRSLAEEKIKKSWDKLPIFIRLELLMELAGFALDHTDRPKALELVNEAQNIMGAYQWPLEHRLPMMAKLTGLRFHTGDEQKARADADALRALFDAEGKKIANIYRAGALRPLAEVYRSMGDAKTALSVYKQAVEEGVENPNSRPRALDLSAACCSMAIYAAEPDANLWERIRQIHKGLGQPW